MINRYLPFKFLLLALFMGSCATYKVQYRKSYIPDASIEESAISHSFYLIGDGGNSPIGDATYPVKALKERLKTANPNSTVLFLGDNVYPKGIPEKGHKNRAFAEYQLEIQSDATKGFSGNVIFIPGNHDWYADGLKGLKRQQDILEEINKNKNILLPGDGCPLKQVKISDDVVVIIVDSQWFVTNWDKHPSINNECDIKSRDKFFLEFESLIKKNVNKTTIVAIHHPVFDYGAHGGQYPADKILFIKKNVPVPMLGLLEGFLRKTSGLSPADISHKRYIELKKRLVTLAHFSEKVVFVSGHDHNLQYIVEENIPQIISGSGSKTMAARMMNGSQFSYGGLGYAQLDVFKNGSSKVTYYATDEQGEKVIFQSTVYPKTDIQTTQYDLKDFPKTYTASIYSKKETSKNGFYRFFWGNRYRKYYSMPVTAPTVDLDTLFGGLTAIRKGGGNQSVSLRLENPEGKEYVMRALRKSAEVFLQANAFKHEYVIGKLEDTQTEKLLSDLYTGSHPYIPFTIETLCEALDIYHSKPKLYYVTKQNALGHYNDTFGDALYMIEERQSSGHGDLKNYGYANKIISTDDLFEKLRKDEKHQVDAEAYIRARLFDMLIGDWDRHSDQWRWAVFEEDEKKIYRAIPRDRDHAYSLFGDGFISNLAVRAMPPLQHMQVYGGDIRNVRTFTMTAYALDMAMVNHAPKKIWDEQVLYIQNHITKEVVDASFKRLPEEVQDETVKKIKKNLLLRLKNLKDISDEYYKILQKYAIITGTDKDDWFEIERMPNGKTKVTAYRIKKGQKADVIHERSYDPKQTKEIWIYGLDDKDRFEVKGEGKARIKVRLTGGQHKDTYSVEKNRKVYVYDFKSKKNVFENVKNAHLTDDYESNIYNYKKIKSNTNQLLPLIDINPDDGVRLGLTNVYTVYGFNRNPFTQQHTMKGAVYTASHSFDLSYSGEFANLINQWNGQIHVYATSPKYTVNYFGTGNETSIDPEQEEDYNRVRYETRKIVPSLVRRGQLGSVFKIGFLYQSVEVEETPDRYISEPGAVDNPDIFDVQHFAGAEMSYEFKNLDVPVFPARGMSMDLLTGWKYNLDKPDKKFGYIIPSISFFYPLEGYGKVVLATKLKGRITIGDGYEIYQGAYIGGSNGLRGFRNERFNGRNSFYQNSDIRINIGKVRNNIFPMEYGIYGGFDYGRVWVEDDTSDVWHTSYGGGLFINFSDFTLANVALFHSADGNRFQFAIGLNF